MNPVIVYRLARYYMRSGMNFSTAVKQAVANQRQSSKFGVHQ